MRNYSNLPEVGENDEMFAGSLVQVQIRLSQSQIQIQKFSSSHIFDVEWPQIKGTFLGPISDRKTQIPTALLPSIIVECVVNEKEGRGKIFLKIQMIDRPVNSSRQRAVQQLHFW